MRVGNNRRNIRPVARRALIDPATFSNPPHPRPPMTIRVPHAKPDGRDVGKSFWMRHGRLPPDEVSEG